MAQTSCSSLFSSLYIPPQIFDFSVTDQKLRVFLKQERPDLFDKWQQLIKKNPNGPSESDMLHFLSNVFLKNILKKTNDGYYEKLATRIPHVIRFTAQDLSFADFIRMRSSGEFAVGIIFKPQFVDGIQLNPEQFLRHDYVHAADALQRDLAVFHEFYLSNLDFYKRGQIIETRLLNQLVDRIESLSDPVFQDLLLRYFFTGLHENSSALLSFVRLNGSFEDVFIDMLSDLKTNRLGISVTKPSELVLRRSELKNFVSSWLEETRKSLSYELGLSL